MQLKNCPECGKVYVENPSGLCPACIEVEEGEELRIVEFLREHGKSSIEQIHKATGVKEKTILRMMKRGRFVGDFEITYPCESCGTPIEEGRLCLACSKNLLDQMNKPEVKTETEPTKVIGRMYTKDIFKRK